MDIADARALDDRDPLAGFRRRFIAPGEHDRVVAYLDGNSLGRPPLATRDRLIELIDEQWAGRLIRSWSEGWLELPAQIGDRLAAAVLGAAPGQTIVADSTTVCLYKTLRAAAALRPDRTEIVTDRHNFPTDSYVVDGVATELGMTVRWIDSDPASGVTVEQVAETLGDRTAVLLLSHVAYRSAYLADMAAITALTHRHGAVVVWDLCHSVGSVPVELDACGVDFAVGCTYKFLNAGPGAPAFLYVRAEHQDDFAAAIPGWMGHDDPFAMEKAYRPAAGIKRALSGTPPVTGLIGVEQGVALVEQAGIDRIRTKAVELTEFVTALVDVWLVPLGAGYGSPRDPRLRGGHVTVTHPDAARISTTLIERGVIVDHRPPGGIRIGLSPLTTSFAETYSAMEIFRDILDGATAG
ncbi:MULTISPECIES: kynureninase [Pseudonocardia]|uniref:Kynureninase n=2 Tax=Pseudonocardia TaxID=1847 RepID=A0A1Y2MGH1_PSEAH|nr:MULTISPECIES: kynureninase [Pseudonocardia]OSY34386.1 Kynureninase [Pseudonocardia autotrophica]TDN76089.1 kynureninase [Pseudonocardia autotrophica]BBG00067.1 kynureninase [Pseudonocardia autotrophica]GEC29792.1 kynureninase [Pseudonocardia saturnea]